MPPSTSTRWCPTPEQLMILEEMYKSGLRTPNASQIQKITSHLSFYGKIEGKNVFYWFQNHKARDRQKLRRNLHMHAHHNINIFKSFAPIHSNNCFALHQPSAHHNYPSSHLHLHQVGPVDAAEITNFNWKSDTSDIQKQQNKGVKNSNDDDWMMMMLKEACDASYNSCSCMNTRPLKTLDLFPINSPSSSVKENQELQHDCPDNNVIKPLDD